MDEDKTGGGDGWAALPWVPLLEAFSLLDRPSYLAHAGLVCRAWHAAATDNRVWRRLCQRDWRIRRPFGASQANSAEGVDFKRLYGEMVQEHGEYRALYAGVSDMWEAYEKWLAAKLPQITLMPAATPEAVRQLEEVLGAELPLEMKCSLRIRNGQNLITNLSGLLGGYSFYDHRVEMQLLGVNDIRLLSDTITRHVQNDPLFPQWLAKACPIARSRFMGKIVFVLLHDLEGHGSRGNVVACSEDYQHTFLLARDYTSYLSDHLANLTKGLYKLDEKCQINLFPQPGARGVGVATTHGITVETSPLFVPEKSSLRSDPPSYFWAYQIRMHMPADCSARSSQLKSRHWVITSADGQVQEVRGRGVIGLFPVMEPGAYFEYESCCPQPAPHGTMKGSFTMEYLDSHEEFEVVVPEFEFFLPPGSRPEAS